MTGSERQRTAIVTGGSSGIGFAIASRLVEDGYRVAIVGRDAGRLEAAVARLGNAAIGQAADLSVRRDAASAVAAIVARWPRIDVLVNNAGAVFTRRTVTPDGVEATFAVNHLAGFLLTELLLDRLRESAPSRIVFTSSEGHQGGTLDLDDIGFEHGYSIMRAYSRSKLANVLTARHLARRLAGSGVTVTSLHPGAIATNIWSGAPWFARPVLAIAKRRMEPPAVGGSRLAYLAASPEVEGATGGYYDHNRLRDPSRLARDDALGDRLYAVSAGLVGLAGTTR